jgi:TfoX/Sxy family transcriptional regulator of competence genes
MEISVDETDLIARHLYESLGFTNRSGGSDEQTCTSTNAISAPRWLIPTFVAVGAETQAGLTDLGVMPKPGGEGRTGEARLSASRLPCAMIVTVAYDEDLANRIRELIASEDGYTEQKMFGGIGFMIDGHMALGVSGEGGLLIHCSKEETEALLAKPGARPFEMRGREMKGWLRVDAESVSTKRALAPWVMQSVAFARALPPKEGK